MVYRNVTGTQTMKKLTTAQAHSLRQSIETRYLPWTNHRPARVIATTTSGIRLVLNWDHEETLENNHYAAAKALQEKLNWSPIKAGSATKKGYIWLRTTFDTEER
jgi:hypothetical protein